MSIIVKVKQTTLMVSESPVYFNTGICILIIALSFFLYQIGYKLKENSERKAVAASVVYFDLLMKTEIDSIKPLILDENLIDQQWALHDSITEVRKKNFESLFVVSNEQVTINLDIPTTIKEKDVMDNIAYQAVNYAHILQKRAPSNHIKTMRLYMSEKVPMGKAITIDFEYDKLLKIEVDAKRKVVDILKIGQIPTAEQGSPSMIKITQDWCKKTKATMPMCL